MEEMEEIDVQNSHNILHKLEKELQRLNNSYQVIPQPPPKRYIHRKCGICKDFSVKIGILIACLLPGIIVCIIGGKVLNDPTVTVIGACLIGSLGFLLALFFIWLYGRKEKSIEKQWDEYWGVKAKIVQNNWGIDDRKRRLIHLISNLKEQIIVSSPSAPIDPSAPPIELFPPDPSAPPIDFDQSTNDQSSSNDQFSEFPECHHCYCRLKQNDIYTYYCCRAFKGHKNCLIEWGKYSQLCPICRTNLGNIHDAIIVFHIQ